MKRNAKHVTESAITVSLLAYMAQRTLAAMDLMSYLLSSMSRALSAIQGTSEELKACKSLFGNPPLKKHL